MPGLLCLLIVIIVSATNVFAQEGSRSIIVTGVVIDSLLQQPIPDAHVSTKLQGVITDDHGRFSVQASGDDVIYITHINFHPRKIIISGGDSIRIQMRQNVRVLREIRVRDIGSEEALKERVLESNLVISTQKQAAQQNSNQINQFSKVAPTPNPTVQEQFLESLQGPKDVTIFSSKGGGLIKAIKNITNPPKAKMITAPSNYRSDPTKVTPFKVKLQERDTVQQDSTLVIEVDKQVVGDGEED